MIENYEYTSEQMDELKKYRVMKVLFLLLGCLVLLLQSISWLVVWIRDMPVDFTNKVFVTITLIGTFSFVISQSFLLVRNKNIRNIIEREGKYDGTRLKLRFSNKSSWGGAFAIFFRIIAIVFLILLGILIVSFIQNYLNWGKIILKTPLMVLMAVQFLNLSAEIRYQIMLEKDKK